MKDCPKDKLLGCRSFAEAKKILETEKASPTALELTKIAFANPNSRDVLLQPVIQEMEDHTSGNQAKGDENPGEKDVKKLTEEQVQHPRDSEGSSDSTQPYPGEGKDAPNSDIESSQTASGEDQMKEMGGMPGMGGMPPVAPQLQQGMQPQLPQGLNPAMMKQMQYTVDRAMAPVIRQLGKINEAIKAHDEALQETRKANSMTLNIPQNTGKSFFKTTQETAMENPVDASAFGLGLLVAMISPRRFEQITPNGPEENELPSMLDRKYSNALTMHITERRYIPRNVFIAQDAQKEERDQLRGDLANLSPNEDFVFGNKVEVQELGAAQRAFDPTLFTDTVQGPIFKALNDFRGKQGSESSHQYANAKTSAVLDEIGLASFPLAVTRQLIKFLFEPWYNENPIFSTDYGGGMAAMPWDACQFELNFGEVEKKDIDPKDMIVMIEKAVTTRAITDPMEIRELWERAGLPLSKEYTEMMNQQYNDPMGQMALNNLNIPQVSDFGANGGGPTWDTTPTDLAPRPFDDRIYQDMAIDVRPTDSRLNFTKKVSRKPIV